VEPKSPARSGKRMCTRLRFRRSLGRGPRGSATPRKHTARPASPTTASTANIAKRRGVIAAWSPSRLERSKPGSPRSNLFSPGATPYDWKP